MPPSFLTSPFWLYVLSFPTVFSPLFSLLIFLHCFLSSPSLFPLLFNYLLVSSCLLSSPPLSPLLVSFPFPSFISSHVPLSPLSPHLLFPPCLPSSSYFLFFLYCTSSHLLSSPHWTVDSSNNSFQQPMCFVWKKTERGEKKETDRCLKKKESRESNAKLKALWKALETAGCPGGNLKILPQETVKEKVWQSVWNMLYIHKGSENLIDSSTTLVSARFTVLYIVFSFTWLGFVELFFKIMPWMWILHSVFVCCFTLSVIQLVEVHVTHLSFFICFLLHSGHFPLWITWFRVQGCNKHLDIIIFFFPRRKQIQV